VTQKVKGSLKVPTPVEAAFRTTKEEDPIVSVSLTTGLKSWIPLVCDPNAKQ